jgi:prepilin-type N-terminal cleavage/methylation domain-containing protein
MKKNTIKAFTLVEMLIVIVIIGILIASLMPRMQTAQGRARDVARKNDLSQIQTAIITSQSDRGAWPGMPKNH